ncbi:hypothetical protein [Xanthocytophaga flava]|uniref:hypothetical protein n=1 Tax=Xanthocytophaga flava TaxID=3048013 RepID=UPI0028D44BFA|nr:hypothetical protein [Xanthocytophaga flavus]MDJ1467265.1 hypothetical protein [Xanthocytophaga flavus]
MGSLVLYVSTLTLVHYVLEGLKRIYKEGIEYKKAGILLDGICPAHSQQYH